MPELGIFPYQWTGYGKITKAGQREANPEGGQFGSLLLEVSNQSDKQMPELGITKHRILHQH